MKVIKDKVILCSFKGIVMMGRITFKQLRYFFKTMISLFPRGINNNKTQAIMKKKISYRPNIKKIGIAIYQLLSKFEKIGIGIRP